ncbi:hypothetical protein Tco_1137273 [Tanacetum coccineum]
MEGSFSCLPNWADEEDWVNVRTNHLDEISKISEESLYTDLDMENNDSESTRTDSFLSSEFYILEEHSNSSRIMLESNVLESDDEIVVTSTNGNALLANILFRILYLDGRSNFLKR